MNEAVERCSKFYEESERLCPLFGLLCSSPCSNRQILTILFCLLTLPATFNDKVQKKNIILFSFYTPHLSGTSFRYIFQVA